MDRKEFLKYGAMGVFGMTMLPANLFAQQTKTANKSLFPAALPFSTKGEWKEFEISIGITEQTLAPAMKIHTLAFNDMVPGPEIRVKQGDKVRVIFKNNTDLNHTIHWHGIYVPWRMDGVPYVTQMPVMPGQEFVYEFTAEPYGTHFYHCHWGTLLHMQSGMFGSVIIESDDDPIKKAFPYEREYTLIYSAHDVNYIRNELNSMLERMKERSFLMKNGRFSAERFNLFNTKEELLESINNGYQPPYLTNQRTSAELPIPNWFTVNGKSYPSTPYLFIKTGENIRIRLINAGTENHHLHLHGHDFWMVWDDGGPLPQPWQRNTVSLSPGKTYDIIVEGNNRGIWTFHDHDTRRVTNNGLYPGGNLLALVYEDLPKKERMVGGMSNMKMQGEMNLLPKIALDE
ncbi:MAG: multicopper oxidase domain-containing protein [Candidatus Marinimicrobia bacterium]|nr:multicopper oxidase domain-containing protein [Candidatus Neomarinimicrobiota bacterium]